MALMCLFLIIELIKMLICILDIFLICTLFISFPVMLAMQIAFV